MMASLVASASCFIIFSSAIFFLAFGKKVNSMKKYINHNNNNHDFGIKVFIYYCIMNQLQNDPFINPINSNNNNNNNICLWHIYVLYLILFIIN